jgi:hypothetical protein
MKNLFILFSFAVLMQSCTGSSEIEIGNKTTMVVEPVYEAGSVVRGEVITAKIKVSNTGSYPLVIASVSPSCSCTIAERPEEPVQPGESAIIIARVDTGKISGKIVNKAVNIVANTEPSTTAVIIRAKINKD